MTDLIINEEILTAFNNVGSRMNRAAQAFEFWQKYARRLKKGEQMDKFQAANFVQVYRMVQTICYVENPRLGRKIADEVKRWQAATIANRYTGAEIPLIELTEPMAANVNAVHTWFDQLEAE